MADTFDNIGDYKSEYYENGGFQYNQSQIAAENTAKLDAVSVSQESNFAYTDFSKDRMGYNQKQSEEAAKAAEKKQKDAVEAATMKQYNIEGDDNLDLNSKDPTPTPKIYMGRYKKEKEKPYFHSVGFYYDSQIEDPCLSISLHANKHYNEETKEWEPWSAFSSDLLEAVASDRKWSGEYGAEPIAKAIMNEDFNFSINNDWSNTGGGGAIEGLYKQFRSYAPLLEKAGNGLQEGIDNVGNLGNFGSDAVKLVQDLFGGGYGINVADVLKRTGGALNSALIVQGTRFSYYNGSQFGLNNMDMKYYVFSDWVYDPKTKNYEFKTVDDYLKKIYPYVQGIYEPWDVSEVVNKSIDKTADVTGMSNETREQVKKGAKNATDFVKSMVGFQNPPAGFHMDVKTLNNTLEGTLRLNIGNSYAIENLVIKTMTTNISKVQAKDPRPEHSGETVPLYAEISLSLAPSISLIDTTYNDIINHKGMNDSRKAKSDSYKADLIELKNKIK